MSSVRRKWDLVSNRDHRTTLVCPCHDVTLADVEDALAHGHSHIETVKRATAVFMGACQGKVCGETVRALVAAHATEDKVEADALAGVLRPAARLPYRPVLLGNLVDPESA